MTRTYCDQCHVEMTEQNAPKFACPTNSLNRLQASIGHLMVEVIVAQNNTWNKGDYCKYCVLDALYKLDDRDK